MVRTANCEMCKSLDFIWWQVKTIGEQACFSLASGHMPYSEHNGDTSH